MYLSLCKIQSAQAIELEQFKELPSQQQYFNIQLISSYNGLFCAIWTGSQYLPWESVLSCDSTPIKAKHYIFVVCQKIVQDIHQNLSS